MSTRHSTLQGQSPFLARTSVPRSGEDTLPGHYSSAMDMWVIETSDGPVPVIRKGALAELHTKTKVQTEQDDTLDSQAVCDQMLQLFSKTDSVSERDDPGYDISVLQLLTKTNVELEHDDNGDTFLSFDA